MSIIQDLKMQYRVGGIVNKLIFWNIGCFIVSLLFFWQFRLGHFIYPDWLALSAVPLTAVTFPWTFVTYAFLHSGFLHLLVNMLILNFAGRLFLTFFSERQLLGLYLLSSIFGGLLFILSFWFLFGGSGSVVGASGAIVAILVATTAYRPLMELRLLLIGNVKLWHVTAVLIVVDLMQLLTENTGGHIVHLAGAVFGFIYIKLLTQGTDLSRGISRALDWVSGIFGKKEKAPFRTVHKNYNRRPAARPAKIVTKDRTQQQIDEILDKISQSGYDSLSQQEKEFLFKAGK